MIAIVRKCTFLILIILMVGCQSDTAYKHYSISPEKPEVLGGYPRQVAYYHISSIVPMDQVGDTYLIKKNRRGQPLHIYPTENKSWYNSKGENLSNLENKKISNRHQNTIRRIKSLEEKIPIETKNILDDFIKGKKQVPWKDLEVLESLTQKKREALKSLDFLKKSTNGNISFLRELESYIEKIDDPYDMFKVQYDDKKISLQTLEALEVIIEDKDAISLEILESLFEIETEKEVLWKISRISDIYIMIKDKFPPEILKFLEAFLIKDDKDIALVKKLIEDEENTALKISEFFEIVNDFFKSESQHQNKNSLKEDSDTELYKALLPLKNFIEGKQDITKEEMIVLEKFFKNIENDKRKDTSQTLGKLAESRNLFQVFQDFQEEKNKIFEKDDLSSQEKLKMFLIKEPKIRWEVLEAWSAIIENKEAYSKIGKYLEDSIGNKKNIPWKALRAWATLFKYEEEIALELSEIFEKSISYNERFLLKLEGLDLNDNIFLKEKFYFEILKKFLIEKVDLKILKEQINLIKIKRIHPDDIDTVFENKKNVYWDTLKNYVRDARSVYLAKRGNTVEILESNYTRKTAMESMTEEVTLAPSNSSYSKDKRKEIIKAFAEINDSLAQLKYLHSLEYLFDILKDSENTKDALEDAKDALEDDSNVKNPKNVLKDALEDAKDTRDSFKDAKSALEDAKDTSEKTENTLRKAKDALKDVESALKDTKNAFKEAKDASESAKDTSEDVKDALEDAKDAFKDAKNISKDAKDALKDAKDALEDAEEDAEDVLKDAKDALEDAEDAFKDAKDISEDANNSLEDTKDALEDSKDNKNKNTLEDAKDNLKEAEDTLEYAKNALEDAENTSKDAKDTLEDAKEALEYAKNTLEKNTSIEDQIKEAQEVFNGAMKRLIENLEDHNWIVFSWNNLESLSGELSTKASLFNQLNINARKDIDRQGIAMCSGFKAESLNIHKTITGSHQTINSHHFDRLYKLTYLLKVRDLITISNKDITEKVKKKIKINYKYIKDKKAIEKALALAEISFNLYYSRLERLQSITSLSTWEESKDETFSENENWITFSAVLTNLEDLEDLYRESGNKKYFFTHWKNRVSKRLRW